MTEEQFNRRARFARLGVAGSASGGGKHTTVSVLTTSTGFTCDPKCVAFRLFNMGTANVFFRCDGTAPTTTVGFPLLANTGDSGWVEVVGSLPIQLISGTTGQRVEIWEILDE